MSRRPKVVDMDTGEELFPSLPVIPKPNYPKGPSAKPASNSNSGINMSEAAAAAQVGVQVWNSLTPEQKQKVLNALKKVAVATPVVIGKSVHHLQYLKYVPGALKNIFGGSKRKKTSKSTSKSTVINSNEGQFTVINKPSSTVVPKPRPRPGQVVIF